MAQETSIPQQLESLVRLQFLDSEVDKLKKLRGDLPDEISDLEDEQSGLQTRISNFKEEQQNNQVARRQSELDIKEAEQLIKKYEDQQMQVRNNREYDALTKEIEAQKQRKIDAVLRIDQIDSGIAPLQSSIEHSEGRLADLDAVLKEKRKQLDAVLKDTKQEQDRFEKLREKASEDVAERYLRAYHRLRTRLRDGRAVVPLDRGAAAGFAVPPQRQVDIRQRNRIIACEHTGRIIVDQDLFEEVQERTREDAS